MTSRTILLITPLVFGAQGANTRDVSQDPRSVVCGRVVTVSCDGPTSAVRLQLASPAGNLQIVVPQEHRQIFGQRIEDRYEQRLVCVNAAGTTASSNRVLVRDPADIVITDAQSPPPLPDNVARTCDPDVRLPILTRDVKPQYTADAMRAKVRGSVFLRGIVDSSGTVRDVHVVQSLEASLDDAARKAFAQWKFQPATRGGEPVPIAISVQMAFTTR